MMMLSFILGAVTPSDEASDTRTLLTSSATASVPTMFPSTIMTLRPQQTISSTTGQPQQLDFRTPTPTAILEVFSSSSSPVSTSSAGVTSRAPTSTLPIPSSSSAISTTTTTTMATTTHHHHHTMNVYNEPPAKFQPDRLATLDLIIIVVYLCLLISTSISTMLRRKKKPGSKSLDSHILAGRKMNWFTVGASIFASNMGSEHFIGLSGSAAASGIAVGAFEINALLILQLATWIFLPVLIVSKICTLPEYMSKRFGGKRIRTYLAVLSIMLYIFTKISVNLYSGGIFIQQALGWNLYTSAIFILLITSVITVTGGMKGAMYVDTLQCLVMTIGASIVATKAFIVIGGWQGLRHKYSQAVPVKVPANLTHCAQPNVHAFQMLRNWDDPDMPWIGFILGQTTASIWYWAADQMMVQRFLSARSLAHVQGSSVFAGYLKILPLFFIIIPGMISRCLYTDEVGCVDPVECHNYCQSTVSCSNTAYPRLVLELMPVGARGMMVASMVAALMGDLVNVFNSASALFSCDIWPLLRRKSTEKELLVAGRIFVFVLVFASILWIPVIQEMQGGQLYIYIQAISALFAPPIAAVYICAVLCKRTNECGAFWSLMIGFSLGLTRMILSFLYREPSCGQFEDERPWVLKHVHYMYYAAFLFWVSISTTLIISYLTKPPSPFRLIRTTYWTRFDTHIRKDDKNVFEMKYNGATTNQMDGSDRAMINGSSNSTNTNYTDVPYDKNLTDLESYGASTKASQQRLFTIDEHEDGPSSGGGGIDNRMMNESFLVDGVQDRNDDNNDDDDMIGTKTNGRKDLSKKRQYRLPPSALPSPTSTPGASAGKFIASTFGVATGQVGAKLGAVRAAANHFNQNKIKFQNLPDDVSELGDADQDPDEDDEDDRIHLDDNLDGSTEGGTYKCLDNSVALLIKTFYEELMLRIALVAVILVALGIFIVFSIPPTPLPKDIIDILRQN